MMMISLNLEDIATEDLASARSSLAVSSIHHADDDDNDDAIHDGGYDRKDDNADEMIKMTVLKVLSFARGR